MSNRKLLVTVLSIVFLLAALSVGLQSVVVSQSPATATQASEVASPTIPFELINRHIILKIRVNDSRPLSFVLDTGDQFAIIDLERAKELKINLGSSVRVGGAGAATQLGAYVKNAKFTIPELPGFSQPVTLALPINSLAPRLGQDFDGIIGSEFIQQFVVEIDYQARLLKLHDRKSFEYSGPGESIPIQLNHGHPIVDAEVTPSGSQPLKGKFVLDLGAGLALALYSPFVKQHHLLESNAQTIQSLGGAGAGGETSGRIGRVDELTIGTFKIKSPTTLFSQDNAGAFADRALAGNIGARVAMKFRVFLDYNRNRIILEPNSTFADAYDQAHSGLSLVAEGTGYHTFRIRRLLENSPATEAGLQTDDIIVRINDQLASELTLSKVNEMFERPVRYRLTIQRGEQTIETTLTPRRLI